MLWPPPIIPFTGFWLNLTVQWEGPEDWPACRLLFTCSNALSNTQLTSIYNAWRSAWFTYVYNFLPIGGVWRGVQASCGSGAVIQHQRLFVEALPGINPFDVLPSAYAVCVQRIRKGVSHRPYPRLNWPFIPQAFYSGDNNRLNLLGRAYFADFATLSITPITGGGSTAVPCYFPGTPPGAPVRYNDWRDPILSYVHKRRPREERNRWPSYPDF